MKAVFLFALFILIGRVLTGQTMEGVSEWAAEIMEALSEETEGQDFSYLTEELTRLVNHPININLATKEDLEQIIFLNDLQIENLLYQRYLNGPFYSIYELQAVEGFNQRLIGWLEPLVVFGPAEARAVKFRRRGDWFLRSRFTLETPVGYKATEESPARFQGNKAHLYSRFQMELTPTLEAGVVAEKDAGEPMFHKDVPLLDFQSGYLLWKPEKFVRQIVVGQYQITGGQGLVLQSGMEPRKSSVTTSIDNRRGSLRPALSVNEYSGLSGLAMSLGTKAFSLTPFFSSARRDGSLAVDENGNVGITSLGADGYHRTTSELAARKNTREEVLGVLAKYVWKRFAFEAGHLQYRLQHPLYPEVRPHNLSYFRGRETHNTWLATEGSVGNVFLFSELAFNRSAEPAVTAGLLFSPSDPVTMVAAWRRIPLDFTAPLGAPFAETSRGSGESGFYTGVQMDLPARLTLSAYLDYFRLQWLQYQTKSPSNGYDFLLNLHHQPDRQWENSFRFRFKEKMVNLASEGPDFPVGPRRQYQFRLQTRFSMADTWSFTTRCDYHRVTLPGENIPSGFYLGQEVKYSHPGNRWYVVTRYGVVDAEDYETRIYVYEPDVLYSFSTPAYAGQAQRWIIMGKWTVIKNLDVWLRYSWWHYTDREAISSGNTMVESNVLRELRFQLRKRF